MTKTCFRTNSNLQNKSKITFINKSPDFILLKTGKYAIKCYTARIVNHQYITKCCNKIIQLIFRP